jgi:hypothetical protein
MTSLAQTYDPKRGCALQKCMEQEVKHGIEGDLMGYQEFVCMRQAGQKSGMRTYEHQVGPAERLAGEYFGAEYNKTNPSEPWIRAAEQVPCSRLQSLLDTPAYGLDGYRASQRACAKCPPGGPSVLTQMHADPGYGIKRCGGSGPATITPSRLRPARHSGDQSWILILILLLIVVAVLAVVA